MSDFDLRVGISRKHNTPDATHTQHPKLAINRLVDHNLRLRLSTRTCKHHNGRVWVSYRKPVSTDTSNLRKQQQHCQHMWYSDPPSPVHSREDAESSGLLVWHWKLSVGPNRSARFGSVSAHAYFFTLLRATYTGPETHCPLVVLREACVAEAGKGACDDCESTCTARHVITGVDIKETAHSQFVISVD